MGLKIKVLDLCVELHRLRHVEGLSDDKKAMVKKFEMRLLFGIYSYMQEHRKGWDVGFDLNYSKLQFSVAKRNSSARLYIGSYIISDPEISSGFIVEFIYMNGKIILSSSSGNYLRMVSPSKTILDDILEKKVHIADACVYGIDSEGHLLWV